MIVTYTRPLPVLAVRVAAAGPLVEFTSDRVKERNDVGFGTPAL